MKDIMNHPVLANFRMISGIPRRSGHEEAVSNRIASRARELGLECIAEGVETEEQVRVLKDNKCALAQGFFFEKPLPVEDFEQRLEMKQYQVV